MTKSFMWFKLFAFSTVLSLLFLGSCQNAPSDSWVSLNDYLEHNMSGMPTIMFIEADHCSACNRLKSEVLTESFLNREPASNVQWVKATIDSDEQVIYQNQHLSVLEFSIRYQTTSTPTLLLFREGGEFVGLQPGFVRRSRVLELIELVQSAREIDF